MAENQKILLRVKHIKKHFPTEKKGKVLKAVDDISLEIYEGETLGIVGESGCGKSTLGRTILGLIPATEGSVEYWGREKEQGMLELTKLDQESLRQLRTDLQLIFQDPYSSLNPRMKIGDLIGEGMSVHGYYPWKSKEKDEKVKELMKSCGLSETMMVRYPREFSGGQRQRIAIARALATYPRFVVCDECVSALDVSVQSQIINLLQDLKEQNSLTYLFISHDLSVVKYISDRIGVMYLGGLVELSDAEDLFEHPLHPYTRGLLASVPRIMDTATGDRTAENSDEITLLTKGLEGDIPSPVDPPSGCKFHTRCPYATDKCRTIAPEWREVRAGHFAACHEI